MKLRVHLSFVPNFEKKNTSGAGPSKLKNAVGFLSISLRLQGFDRLFTDLVTRFCRTTQHNKLSNTKIFSK